MSLNYRAYTAGTTVITAANMNDIQQNIINCCGYTTCSTGASTTAKVASLPNFILMTGARVTIKFTHGNTVGSPTLNINGTGAKPILRCDSVNAGNNASSSWADGEVVDFVYDGSSWVIVKGASIVATDLGEF